METTVLSCWYTKAARHSVSECTYHFNFPEEWEDAREQILLTGIWISDERHVSWVNFRYNNLFISTCMYTVHEEVATNLIAPFKVPVIIVQYDPNNCVDVDYKYIQLNTRSMPDNLTVTLQWCFHDGHETLAYDLQSFAYNDTYYSIDGVYGLSERDAVYIITNNMDAENVEMENGTMVSPCAVSFEGPLDCGSIRFKVVGEVYFRLIKFRVSDFTD